MTNELKVESFPIPFDKRNGFIWQNGGMIAWKDATVHVLNHGLHYGSCVFEGLRVYGGVPFKLHEHNERLHKSAEILGFAIPYSIEQLNEATLEVIEAQKIVNGYVRPFAWRGSEQLAIVTDRTTTNVAIAAWQWPAYYTEEAKLKGARLTFAKWKRPSPETAPSSAKAAGLYMIATMSKNLAQQQGFQEALMLDWQGRIAETTSSNFFMIVGDEIHTPIADCFLDGITRRTVIELARKRGIKVVERRIMPEELADASGAFLTGSAAELTPVASIDDYKFTVCDTIIGLMNDYKQLVENWKN